MHTAKRIGMIAVVVMIGCGGGAQKSEGDAGASDVFVAFSADFKGFRKWHSFDVTMSDDAGAPHPQPTLTEYIDTLPPHGASEFLLRTIIVKEGHDPAVTSFFAMVKRGGDFNKTGARNWEWFELTDLDKTANTVRIVWHGNGPPNGSDVYGGDPSGGCNKCHTPDKNDCVLAPALNLANF